MTGALLPCRRLSWKSDDMATGDYPRTLRPPSESFFLFGIRGVGKSTWGRCELTSDLCQGKKPAGYTPRRMAR